MFPSLSSSQNNGACGYGGYYGATIFAPNQAWYNGSSSCGVCVQVFGALGSTILTVADECPVTGNERWCSGDMTHFDIDQRTFPSLGSSSWGVMLLNWRYVTCPSASNPVNLISKADSSSTWISVMPRDHNTAVSSLQIRESGSANFVSVTRADYNQFEYRNSAGISFPITVRVTNIYGDFIDATMSGPSAGQTVAFPRNFAIPPAASGTCGAPYKYVIYDENINAPTDTTKRTAHDWTASCGTCNLNWQSTAVTAYQGTYSASANIQNYQEFWFATQGPVALSASNLLSVEIALRTPSGSLNSGDLQLFWEGYDQNLIVSVPAVNTTWQKFVFPKSAFPTLPSSLTRIALKNNRNGVSSIYLDAFRIVPVDNTGNVPVASQTPAPTASATPKSNGNQAPTSASSSPSAAAQGPSKQNSAHARVATSATFLGASALLAVLL
jgi:expansin (peptidoglycan-binding protein)